IAEIAMYLIDHQMNMLLQKEFGQYVASIPLKKGASIVHGDALEINWQSLLNPENTYDVVTKHTNIYLFEEPQNEFKTVNIKTESFQVHKGKKPSETKTIKFDYIIGNPPFIGSKKMSQFQRNQIVRQFDNSKGCGVLDYVSGWYIKAAKYIQNSTIKVAFVSTNSIVQGEQTAILWGQMLNKYEIKIHFAHKTFKWSNEAKGNAVVHCVIVGFANFDSNNKLLFEYEDITGEPTEIKVKNINPYLVDAKNIFVEKRRKPICNVPEISFGSMPNDGGNFLLTDEEYNQIKKSEPYSLKYIKPFIGAHEFLNGQKKWCYWLTDVNPSDWKLMPIAYNKVKEVEKLRKNSTREATRKLAHFSYLFGENRQPESNYILIPRHSSENRAIIPFGFFSTESVAGDTCSTIPNSKLFHLGILQSSMHMAWVNAVCGRLEKRYRYSNEIVYNNFPWPENITDKNIKTIEISIQKILYIREKYNGNSLSDLYKTLTMPSELVKAHQELDKAVDIAYRPQAFASEAKRMEFLFELYEKYTADLFTKEKFKKVKKN
ncbi:type IIL restriction-modification enzyme MmeI, partial [Flavobacterium filum]|uniref:type IIL restriction-modification enzyme MmeI n=1 Tax=Flavobacterium filum TaxID=370974 RepID=UPI003211EB05